MSELVIYLDGRRCGVVEQTDTGNVSFRYDDEYRRGSKPTPLSLSMPLAAASHRKRSILSFLQGLLPDSPEALNAIARRYAVSSSSPFAILRHTGSDVAGAVQIAAAGDEASDATQSRSTVREVDEAEIGQMLRHVVSEYSEGVPYYDSVGHFSLAGAQPKIALHSIADGRWGVPADATPTTHIFKPVSGSIRRIDVVEHMTMHAARLLGNNVAQSELQSIDGLDVFVTERYDREKVDGKWRRLHQEDLCQALSVPPDKKYQHREGGPGLAAIASLIQSFPLDVDRREVGRSFYRAFVFNVIAGCTDAHAKNYSLLLSGESVRLAPLYDLVSYAPYWDGKVRLDSAMSVAGEYAFSRIGVEKLVAAGKQFGVAGEAEDIVAAARAQMVAAFDDARKSMPRTTKDERAIAEDVMRGIRMMPLVLG